MNRSKQLTSVALLSGLLISISLSSPAFARMNKTEVQQFQETVAELEETKSRLARLEQLFEAGNIQQMYIRLQTLDEDNRRLEGRIEELTHQLDKMGQRERELNLDMDKRLQQIESRSSSSGGVMESVSSYSPSEVIDPGTDSVYPRAEEVSLLGEQSQYRQSFDFLKSGQYPAAVQGFKQFLTGYPDSLMAPNAQYWLGEANYGSGKFEQAVKNFQQLRAQHAGTPKVPDASLKLGYSLYELSRWTDAKAILKEVTQQYPGTAVAKLAINRLNRIKQEGH